MRINDKMEKGIFSNLWNTTMASTTKASTTTTTNKPQIIIEDTENIVDYIDNVESFLIVIIVILTIIMVFKMFKLCKKGYKMHNERIILKHQNSTDRL